MATVVDLTLPNGAFPLGELLADEDARIELERVVPVGETLLPFVWVSNGSVEHIERVLDEQSAVDVFDHLTTVDERHLYQLSWGGDFEGFAGALVDSAGVIVSGVGVHGRWEFRIRFPDHDHLKRFSDRCRDEGIRFDVKGVYNPHVPALKDRLTTKQWETVSVAYRKGYFEVPRRATLSDLADHFGVTEQAVSQRLRRALNTLLGGIQFDGTTD
ncbi:helix-turn-helix domain-containing protein [Halomarina rubra]|uniref:Helix-turn-helix domain-containing protein n=1 Tax=Halomarina rubra TaxID=2071873 RepID=A0ABD6B0B6_9EURY|nr:helix-turn-helix domain-containing protein [Halomarina rubra]